MLYVVCCDVLLYFRLFLAREKKLFGDDEKKKRKYVHCNGLQGFTALQLYDTFWFQAHTCTRTDGYMLIIPRPKNGVSLYIDWRA